MSDKGKKPPAEEEEARTVFTPGGGAPPPPPQPTQPPPPAPAEGEKTRKPEAEAPAPAPPPPAAEPGKTAFTARPDARTIKVGDVLNHIFEVKRFIARGGMGEVFEGCNVSSDEKVAIKVMLPALAADEKVVAMFRKEARTLTRLNHEAIVPYRVLAQEPELGVLYIVTDYIDGVVLKEMLGQALPSVEQLAGLLRRLAEGLGAAHEMGAVHRDMSPDNVILPAGDFHEAKIIDFGIAKDLDNSSATIVGDGFAGKLNYVAPEQLGDFGREVGPWTDVYSLALVILAVANGRNVDMSGSLVDAIDKRRKGPDLAAVPDRLRPVLAAMLRPDPKERLRSMDEVVAMLDGQRIPPPPAAGDAQVAAASGGGSRILIVALFLGAALLVAAALWYFLDGAERPAPAPEEKVEAPEPAAAARAAINGVLPSVACTWLDIGRIDETDEGLRVAMRGVAGNGQAAQEEIARALQGAGIAGARVDFGDVAPITQAGCAALDTYRQVREDEELRLSRTQPRFEMAMQPAGLPYAGRPAANAVVELLLADPALGVAIAGIEPSGAITPLILGREAFDRLRARSAAAGRPISDRGGGRYGLHIDLDHEGWSGILLITGEGPFEEDLVAPPIGARGPAWQDRFLPTAAARGWRTEMVWFQSVNAEED